MIVAPSAELLLTPNIDFVKDQSLDCPEVGLRFEATVVHDSFFA